MTPTIQTTFKLATKLCNVKDLFNYGSLIFTNAYGNVTAKIGNSIFHQNLNFDGSADIVVGTNDNVDFDLPLSGDGKVINSSYEIDYSVKIIDEQKANFITVDAPGAATFSDISLNPDTVPIETNIQNIINNSTSVKVAFCDSSNTVLGTSNLIGVGGGLVTFGSITISAFATITYIKLLATTTYTNTFNYNFTNEDQPVAHVNASSDIYRAQVTASDVTQYPTSVTSLARTLTIAYPLKKDGTPSGTTVITSDASKTVGPPIKTGSWTISLSSVISMTQTDNLIVTNTIVAYQPLLVEGDAGLNFLYQCIKNINNNFINGLKRGSKVMELLTEQELVVLGYCNVYRLAVDNGNSPDAQLILAQLKEYLGSQNFSLEQPDQSEPMDIFPLFSSSALSGTINSGTFVPDQILILTVNGADFQFGIKSV